MCLYRGCCRVLYALLAWLTAASRQVMNSQCRSPKYALASVLRIVSAGILLLCLRYVQTSAGGQVGINSLAVTLLASRPAVL